ncbi:MULTISPECIES: hypothetical protein [Methylococcus]|nr:hypothetical protein [Methylococcus capsulatus]
MSDRIASHATFLPKARHHFEDGRQYLLAHTVLQFSGTVGRLIQIPNL